MIKEFIPYEQSIQLKELGFDAPCFDRYDPRFEKPSSDMETWSNEHFPETLMIPAPLYQQAFRWFRKKYGLHSVVNIGITDEWYFELTFFQKEMRKYIRKKKNKICLMTTKKQNLLVLTN